MESGGSISIWFFIGIALVVNGALILGAGLYYFHALPYHVTLSNLHASVWWGALLLALGIFYSIHFRPGRKARS